MAKRDWIYLIHSARFVPFCSVDELARLCDPSGKANKNNRINVVCDAIRVIQQLRVENNQLKQLNKFLEERVGMLERAKAQAMYQQAMAHQMQQSHMLARQQSGAAQSSEPALALPAQPQQQQPQQLQYAADAGMPLMMPVMPSQPAMYPNMALSSQMFGVKHDPLMGEAGMGALVPQPDGHDVTMPLPANAPPVGWLPAPDLNQDEKLRPPAA
jgi:hypothetical protein